MSDGFLEAATRMVAKGVGRIEIAHTMSGAMLPEVLIELRDHWVRLSVREAYGLANAFDSIGHADIGNKLRGNAEWAEVE